MRALGEVFLCFFFYISTIPLAWKVGEISFFPSMVAHKNRQAVENVSMDRPLSSYAS